jgi:hypothetical protein
MARCGALGSLIMLMGCNAAARNLAGAYDAPWRHLHAGMLAYIGSDNTTSNVERRQTVCPSVDLVIRSWEQGGSKQCFTVKHGTPVKIEAVVPARTGTTDRGDPLAWLGAFVKIRAIDRSWKGYTPIGFLQPNIHVGTVILMARDWSDGLTLAPRLDSVKLIDLPRDAHVKVLGYYPQLRGRTLFVKVLEGPYENREGWMAIEDVAPPPTLDAGLYGLVDSSD